MTSVVARFSQGSKASKSRLSSICQKIGFGKLNQPKRPVRTHQATYRLEPKKRFDHDVVENILTRLMMSELQNMEYCDKTAPGISVALADSIRRAVKEENYDRYRIIVSVTIYQRRQQSVQVYHSFLWDPDRDGYATYSLENPHIYANAVVYGVYLD